MSEMPPVFAPSQLNKPSGTSAVYLALALEVKWITERFLLVPYGAGWYLCASASAFLSKAVFITPWQLVTASTCKESWLWGPAVSLPSTWLVLVVEVPGCVFCPLYGKSRPHWSAAVASCCTGPALHARHSVSTWMSLLPIGIYSFAQLPAFLLDCTMRSHIRLWCLEIIKPLYLTQTTKAVKIWNIGPRN